MAGGLTLFETVRYSGLVLWLGTPFRWLKRWRDVKKPCFVCQKNGTRKVDIGVLLCNECRVELLATPDLTRQIADREACLTGRIAKLLAADEKPPKTVGGK